MINKRTAGAELDLENSGVDTFYFSETEFYKNDTKFQRNMGVHGPLGPPLNLPINCTYSIYGMNKTFAFFNFIFLR